MRRLFAAVTRRPMNWNLIDAFTRLEEREEELRARDAQRAKKRDELTDRSGRPAPRRRRSSPPPSPTFTPGALRPAPRSRSRSRKARLRSRLAAGSRPAPHRDA